MYISNNERQIYPNIDHNCSLKSDDTITFEQTNKNELKYPTFLDKRIKLSIYKFRYQCISQSIVPSTPNVNTLFQEETNGSL